MTPDARLIRRAHERGAAILRDLENRYDGPIPPHALKRTYLTDNEVAWQAAECNANFYKALILGPVGCSREGRGQIAAIRRRRADGSFYPELLSDLRLYVRQWKAYMRQVRALRSVVSAERAAAAPMAAE